ncbi:hypothetical protein [Streptomyces odontomachi]|uniref:hypothetical protein n=1 Tax=Streptomyces odontomachi TaxID=2944940 RepID=UPI00210A2DE9|nr:hypothetical protein [Streptomyces sp. ODS25]
MTMPVQLRGLRGRVLRAVPEPVATPFVWAAAFAGSLLLVPVLTMAGALAHPVAALAGYCLLGAVLGLAARAAAAPGIAVLCWLAYDGFVVHREGELGWAGSEDLARLAVLLGAPLLGLAAARTGHAVRAYHRLVPPRTTPDTRT